MYCGNCGQENRDGAHFCAACGERLEETVVPAAQEARGETIEPLETQMHESTMTQQSLRGFDPDRSRQMASEYTERRTQSAWMKWVLYILIAAFAAGIIWQAHTLIKTNIEYHIVQEMK